MDKIPTPDKIFHKKIIRLILCNGQKACIFTGVRRSRIFGLGHCGASVLRDIAAQAGNQVGLVLTDSFGIKAPAREMIFQRQQELAE